MIRMTISVVARLRMSTLAYSARSAGAAGKRSGAAPGRAAPLVDHPPDGGQSRAAPASDGVARPRLRPLAATASALPASFTTAAMPKNSCVTPSYTW